MKYDVLIVDPPWKYDNIKTGGSHKSGAAQKYETMSTLQLLDLDRLITRVMNDDSYIFLWSTNSMIGEALGILAEWGFLYKTMLTWNKMRYGMGYWFRSQTEHCLFGVNGKVPALKSNYRNLITEEPREHSQKPCSFYGMINSLFPNKKILELFATEKYPNDNWTCIGKAITDNDIEKDLKELIQIDNDDYWF